MKYSLVIGMLLAFTEAKHHHHGHTLVQQPSKEAESIAQLASKGLKDLESNDASLSDMYSFSQALASGKTVTEQLTDDQKAAN